MGFFRPVKNIWRNVFYPKKVPFPSNLKSPNTPKTPPKLQKPKTPSAQPGWLSRDEILKDDLKNEWPELNKHRADNWRPFSSSIIPDPKAPYTKPIHVLGFKSPTGEINLTHIQGYDGSKYVYKKLEKPSKLSLEELTKPLYYVLPKTPANRPENGLIDEKRYRSRN